MKLVDQTLFGAGNGNCWGACVATITGIPLDVIPNFSVTHDNTSWYRAFAIWLRPYGFAPVSFLCADERATRNHLDWAADIAPTTPWIAAGDTDRGKHAVVYMGHKLLHDPNPLYGRAGVIRVEDATFFVRTERLE